MDMDDFRVPGFSVQFGAKSREWVDSFLSFCVVRVASFVFMSRYFADVQNRCSAAAAGSGPAGLRPHRAPRQFPWSDRFVQKHFFFPPRKGNDPGASFRTGGKRSTGLPGEFGAFSQRSGGFFGRTRWTSWTSKAFATTCRRATRPVDSGGG